MWGALCRSLTVAVRLRSAAGAVRMRRPARAARSGLLVLALVVLAAPSLAFAQADFVNWETPQVSPLALTPDGNRLLAVNTPDNRLEVFDVSSGSPVHVRSICVGLDPVSVRARNNVEAWVVNHVSDSISIVNLPTGRVVFTIPTGDEPTDVVFAGTPQRAYVSVSQLNQIRVFDPANPGAAPIILNIEGEDPRALTVSPDDTRVFAAIFESGNRTTALRRNAVSNPNGSYGGLNPPPNSGTQFQPPIAPGLPPPPPVGMIVRKQPNGTWRDDNNRNWTPFVTWDLHDHDVAIIDTTPATPSVSYVSGLMNLNMALGVRPDGQVCIVGTDALNHVRFESNIRGTFARVLMAAFDPAAPAAPSIVDLNPHLDYAQPTVAQEIRDLSVGDPRGIVWTTDGVGFVAGMGSNNVIAIDAGGARLATIDVGEGPTGLALNAAQGRLYVLSKFAATVSVIDTALLTELSRTPFFDPTPDLVRLGRPFLYDTHQTSGLGHVSCATCHVDARMDQLAWDLGDPAGNVVPVNQPCRQGPGNCAAWHPMKGPMVTQSLQGIVGAGAMHWRGDRVNLAAFAPAFVNLQGDDAAPSAAQMQLFTDFIAGVRYPPNPNRNLDNTLRAALPATGGNGNAVNGRNLFLNAPITGGAITCVSCHALPTGTNGTIDFVAAAPEPQSLKMAQLRNMHEKTGFSRLSPSNNRGFGYLHDSFDDTLDTFLRTPVFAFPPPPTGDQQRRDIEAFLLSFATDTHAGIGAQVTIDGANNNAPPINNFFNTFLPPANAGQVGLVAHGRVGGLDRGYAYVNGNLFQSDRQGETISVAALRAAATAGGEITFTVVPFGSQARIGIDRDRDGAFDRNEIERCGDPANAAVIPVPRGDVNFSGAVDAADVPVMVNLLVNVGVASERDRCVADFNGDGMLDGEDVSGFLACLIGGNCP